MEITNPQEVQNNDQLPPELQDAAEDQSEGPTYVPRFNRRERTFMITTRMNREQKIELDDHMRKRKVNNSDYSMNKFIIEAVQEKIARDNATPQEMT